MKFARYLQETQTPEWKKAYIDYRGLKKLIVAIRRHMDVQVPSEPVAGPSSAGSAPHSARDSPSVHSEHSTECSPTVGKPISLPVDEPLFPSSAVSTRPRVSLRSRSIMYRRTATLASFTRSRPSTAPETLRDLVELLLPEELTFFTQLDQELGKIEKFYIERDKEMISRTRLLKVQFSELADHRRLFHAVHPSSGARWMSPGALCKKLNLHKTGDQEASQTEDPQSATSHTAPTSPTAPNLDPDEYQRAKRKLKKAVLEHYRGLETLENYRILNLTGFRKALKKFEKVTHIPAQKLYMSEKVDTTALSTDVSLRDMMEEMDDLFAVQFTNGDKKSARAQLRQMSGHTTHHYSTFRSGLLLGLALPALVSGLYQSFQHETREAISGWPALLCVYGILTVLTVFSLLIGLNLVTWARTRINYVFIFELDLRTCVDYREYFEMPSLFVATLCYAFYLSFARIGASHVSPTTWPLVWMGFIALVMFNPLPAFYQPSRFWLTKSIAKLFISGTRRVEFTDFWMGDQFCSLIYVLSNIYFIPCVYVKGFDNYQQCGASSPHWPAQFVIAVLPLVIRLVQSVKRYLDSHLITHLINGGKYGSGIIAYLFYFLWRHHGSYQASYTALWCTTNIIYSTYACSWDYLMDWSVLHVRSEHPLLRDELLYTNHIPMYYFALVTNVVIRFLWIFYLPDIGPSMHLRTFIVAMAEMLRRWQWNFYRLENEHLGNMDQYRVTREVPLPYSLDDVRHNRDDDEVEK